MRIAPRLICVIISLPFAACAAEPATEVCPLAALQIIDSSMISVRVRRGGRCSGYMLIDSEGKEADMLAVRTDQKFSLIEHHGGFEYTFSGVESGRIILKETNRFNAQSFGNGIKTSRRTISVAPYSRMYGERRIALSEGASVEQGQALRSRINLVEKIKHTFPQFSKDFGDPALTFSFVPLVLRDNAAVRKMSLMISIETEPGYAGKMKEPDMNHILDFSEKVVRNALKAVE